MKIMNLNQISGPGGSRGLPDLEGLQRGPRRGDRARGAQLARVLRGGRRRQARILPGMGKISQF